MAGSARVFISYSNKDTAIVGRIRQALAEADVSVWLDHEQLTPGTPDWRAAVLRGIEQATTVIYAASPDAASSKYVAHELAIAEGEGKTILPLWIRGEKWYFCAPMGFYVAQHIDARDAAYAGGLAKLLDALGAAPALQQSQGGRALLPGHHATAAPPVAAPPVAAPPQQPRFPPPYVPARLASLGFRGVNPHGTPAITPPLVSVAAGPFLMGSDKKRDQQARDNETPQHRVDLAAFQIGKYPVTVAEYALAVAAGAVREPPAGGEVTTWRTQLQRLDHPVVCVSWQDANAYITWLREAMQQPGWRLPSEAQWEKAARWDADANASHIYPWGDSFDQARCNTYENRIGTTTPVGSYPANDAQSSGASPCGAEEMAGTVWEWTSSLYKPYQYSDSDGREDQNSTVNRTLRGGSWVDGARGARAAYRYGSRWDYRSNGSGFRLALSRVVAGAAGD